MSRVKQPMGILAGKRVAVTRAADQAGELVGRLESLGAEVVACPTIAFAPPDDPRPLADAARRIGSFAWVVLPSANAARALLAQLEALGCAALNGVRVAAVGPATAEVLRERGLPVDLVPPEHTAAGLLRAVGDVAGLQVLLPQADVARRELADGLRAKGAAVETVTAYRTVPGEGRAGLAARLAEGQVDAVAFASPSAVRHLMDAMEGVGLSRDAARGLLATTLLVAIGPTTAAALRHEGLAVAAVAVPHTAEGLAAAVTAALEGR